MQSRVLTDVADDGCNVSEMNLKLKFEFSQTDPGIQALQLWPRVSISAEKLEIWSHVHQEVAERWLVNDAEWYIVHTPRWHAARDYVRAHPGDRWLTSSE